MLLLLDVTAWAIDVIDRLGYTGVGALVALESVGPPIPSEVILPLAGFQADQGDFNVVLLIAAVLIAIANFNAKRRAGRRLTGTSA